jgi:ferredoxin
MKIQNVRLAYFSPTKTTKITLESISEGIGVPAEHLDLTLPHAEKADAVTMKQDELLIIGAPVYAGRIPEVAVRRFQKLKSKKSPAVIVVLYGNREYEDALVELSDLASAAGFVPVAGGAFVGEHSFSGESAPIAMGRPDPSDVQCAQEFGRGIQNYLRKVRSYEDIQVPNFPGNRPYRDLIRHPPTSPITTEDQCSQCETCASVCPVAAISIGDRIYTEKEKCILCCACIKSCPDRARIFKDPFIAQITEWLRTEASQRKEPETFIAQN